jgi:RHS repeat-associated protein
LLARSDNQKIVPAILSPENPNPENVVTSYYFSDSQGNISALVSPSGMILAQYQYDPFGNLISKSGLMADINKCRYSGKEWEENAGLYYYGYRFYDPNLQRWINRDPLGEPGFETLQGRSSILAGTLFSSYLRPRGDILYAYVLNGPVNHYDPLGLVDRGPGTMACKQAEEQAEAAWELYDAEPSDENLTSAMALSFAAAFYCSPPPPPPPFWQRACECVKTGAEAIGGACLDAAGALGGLWIFIGQDPTANPYHHA